MNRMLPGLEALLGSIAWKYGLDIGELQRMLCKTVIDVDLNAVSGDYDQHGGCSLRTGRSFHQDARAQAGPVQGGFKGSAMADSRHCPLKLAKHWTGE